MILLLGASGFIGRAFQAELSKRHLTFRHLSRQIYSDFQSLRYFLDGIRPDFVICAAGFTGDPNVDACENRKGETILGNVVLPTTIANACASCEIPAGFVSSGCIYDGPAPTAGGFSEGDPPNFTFKTRCSFYSGCKALAENALIDRGVYLWRMRMPFDENPHRKNLISKILKYRVTYDGPPNSMSHLGESVRACIDLWEGGAPHGIYHVTNPGAVTNRQIVEMILQILKPARKFDLWEHDVKLCDETVVAPRSNCVLNTDKLQSAGIKMRQVTDALTEAVSLYKAGT